MDLNSNLLGHVCHSSLSPLEHPLLLSFEAHGWQSPGKTTPGVAGCELHTLVAELGLNMW